jgi:hypothetical protein
MAALIHGRGWFTNLDDLVIENLKTKSKLKGRSSSKSCRTSHQCRTP